MAHIKRINEMITEGGENPASIEFFVDNPRFERNDEYLESILDEFKNIESLGDKGMFVKKPAILIKINKGRELREMTDILVGILNDVYNAERYNRIVFIVRNDDDTIFSIGDMLNRIQPIQKKHNYYPSHLYGIGDHNSVYMELCKYAKTIDEYRK